ncbi:hypothetical protein B0J17DRAFT_226146 [Rhizoctonia solani]|nr:hypothetical protein B0J17DRAFT_226146 [Rhizoctonia solani]
MLSDPEITPRKKQPDDSRVHKLPSELLLRIFLIGEEIDRAARPRELWYLGMQDIVTQVCSHWRDIAVNCPMLWTHIHITRPGPRHLASVYLARAGAVTLLDINIEMRARYYNGLEIGDDDWKHQRAAVPEILYFLDSCGAPVSRWKSLSVSALEPDVLLKFIGTLCAEAAPALRFLSCRLSRLVSVSSEDRIIRDPQYSSDFYQLSPFVVPSLRCVELDRLPWSYVFDRPPPVFAGLTELRLTSGATLSSPAQLQELLSFNPQLEVLSLSTSDTSYEVLNNLEPVSQRIRMQQLNTLSVNTIMNLSWALSVLQLIEAPVLKRLSLSSFVSTKAEDVQIPDLCRFICTHPSGDSALNEFQSPSIHELDIHNFLLRREQVVDIFTCWPSITRLYANRAQLETLWDPLLLPNLSYLKVHFKPHPQLGRILSPGRLQGAQ